jgi:flagellin-specific chaperone FliS
MNPHHTYRQQQALAWSRIDMLLALYQGAIDRLETALAALRRGEHAAARVPLLRAQRIVAELLAGIDPQHGTIAQSLTQLCIYVIEAINRGAAEAIESAIGVLRTIAEGLSAIRNEARELERSGAIPPLGSNPAMQRTA